MVINEDTHCFTLWFCRGDPTGRPYLSTAKFTTPFEGGMVKKTASNAQPSVCDISLGLNICNIPHKCYDSMMQNSGQPKLNPSLL